MPKANALVAELLANVVDVVEATHQNHLEIELGCDIHEGFEGEIADEGALVWRPFRACLSLVSPL